MKKFLVLTLFLSILIFPSWVHADGPYLNIPPTNAFDKAHSQNGTINAVNFSMPINFIGRNGVNVTSNNSTHTIIIIGNGTGPKGATGATGSFVCNTGNNCVNLNDTQTITNQKTFTDGLNTLFYHIGNLFGNLSIQPNAGYSSPTVISLFPENGTTKSSNLDVVGDTNYDNFLEVGSGFGTGGNYIVSRANDTTPLTIQTVQSGFVIKTNMQLSQANNSINFNSAQLTSILNPINNQDAVTKYWHDHYLGKIGNLTQNKCSNLEFLAYQQSNQTWVCSSGSFHGTYNETLANNAVINSGGSKTNYINGTGNPVHVVNSNSGQQVNVTISLATSSSIQGTYNQTLANNTLINSGGNRINFLNNTVNSVNVKNDPTRNQVNVTINGPTFTTRTIDLSSSAYTTVIDNDTADTLITATTKPASPQFVQTISSGNIPTDTTDVQDYTVILTVGGKNTNATTAKTVAMIPTRNGVEVDTTRAVAVTNGNFWESGYYFSSSAVTAGDQIGLKMWCSNSPCTSGGGLDFRYATIYIVPRQFVSTHDLMSLLQVANTLTLSGAVSGVTYSTGTPNLGQNNIGSVIDPILGTSATVSAPVNAIAIKGQHLSELTNVVGGLRSTTDTGVTPAQQAASNLMSVSFAKFVRINTLS